ncbi:MAG TPA: hypothetical protein VED24_01870 [Candidatus Acidoferrum sp.]|nr:hypothetical protein [Candidatus Acidoferrum sp.]
MRDKLTVCIAALMIIFILSASLPAATAEAASGYNVRIDRIVQITGWGLVTVNDTFTVLNNSTASLEGIPVGYPRNLTAGLRYLGVRDDQNKVLTIDRDLDSSSQTYWFRVNFGRALARNETYTFTATSVYTNLLTSALGAFQFEFATTPVLQMRATSENMTITAGSDSSFSVPQWLNLTQTATSGQMNLKGYFAPVEPYTTRSFVLNMTSTTQSIVRVPQVVRQISFAQDGSIQVSETYNFTSLGGSVSTIQLTLPQNSSSVMAYDYVGQLWDAPQTGPDISVSPRYSGGIPLNQTFTFTLKYNVSPGAYVEEINWWGTNKCKLTLLPNLKYWVIEKLQTTIVTPDGFTIRSISPSPFSTSRSLFYHTLSYTLTDVTPYTDLGLSLEYNYTPFWSGSLLLAWLAIAELIVAAAVVISRARKPPALEKPVPSEKLKQFVELYDGRTALRLELDRMAEDLARGALNKHEYRRRRKTIEFRMGEVDRALQPLKENLKASHPSYTEMITRMEKAEAEIDANRLGEEHFKTQYRSGKMSKEAYERALDDLNKRIDRAREVIETSLVTLREEAR